MSPAIIAILILLFCVIMFITELIPSAVAACLGCTLMVLFNVAPFAKAFSGFSNSIVILLFSAKVVGDAMLATGTAQIIGRQVVKFSRNNERLFLLGLCVIAGCLSMFLANTAVIASFLPIIDSVCRTSDKMRRRDFVLPLALGSMFGGCCTLIGCTPQLTSNGILLSMCGFEMKMFDMMAPGLCVLVVYIIYTQLIGFNLGKKIWGNAEEIDMKTDEMLGLSEKSSAPDKKKIITMTVILVLMIISYVGAWLTTTMTALLAAFLSILTGCTNVQSIRKNMNWDAVIFLAATLSIAECLTSSGAADLISETVSPLFSTITSPFMIFAILVLLVLIISNFITNSAAIIIVLPIGLSLCSSFGFNPLPFCIGITFGGSFACSTPLAAAQIAMTLDAGYKFSDFSRYTAILTVFVYFTIILFVPLFFPLV